MPYTPIVQTSRARSAGGYSSEIIPPHATFVLPLAFAPHTSDTISNPVSREAANEMINPALGTWDNGGFLPARPGRYRFYSQFGIYKQESQGDHFEVFLRTEIIRDQTGIIVSVSDEVISLPEETGWERVMAVRTEATPTLRMGDRVQIRFGLLQGELVSILTDHLRTFCDITAYWG